MKAKAFFERLETRLKTVNDELKQIEIQERKLKARKTDILDMVNNQKYLVTEETPVWAVMSYRKGGFAVPNTALKEPDSRRGYGMSEALYNKKTLSYMISNRKYGSLDLHLTEMDAVNAALDNYPNKKDSYGWPIVVIKLWVPQGETLSLSESAIHSSKFNKVSMDVMEPAIPVMSA